MQQQVSDDESIRIAAFARARTLTQVYGDDIPWGAISQGIDLGGEKVFIANKAVGIFKPKQLKLGALSIKTTTPRRGRVNIYADSDDVDGTFKYSLQGDDPNNYYNKLLQECWENQLPILYFRAVAPSIYKAIFPCFVESIDAKNLTCRISVALERDISKLPNMRDSEPWRIEKRYVFRDTKVRLHQAEFRERVLDAYGNRCAMTGLPVPQLLEAAHIVPDNHEQGLAEVKNGICLSRIHHRAFDSNLIGVSADYKIHVSERLLGLEDGIILEGGLKALHGKQLVLPKKEKNKPSQELLALRFEEFKNWVWYE